jgi:hypothetical protein
MAFDPSSGNLAWDPEKKKARDAQRDAAIDRARIGDIYAEWKHQFAKVARTRRDIIQQFYKLKEKLLDVREHSGGFPIVATVEMLDQKIAVLTTIQVCEQNTIKAHVPVTDAAAGAKPKTAQFRSRKDFDAIPWLQHFSKQAGFRGFYRKLAVTGNGLDIHYYILALYESDACLVGELVNDCCWDDFPDYDDAAPATPDTEVKP